MNNNRIESLDLGNSNTKTQEYLMLSALSLIADKGYDNVTIDHIAEETGNTKGAVYHYFKSKKQLYKASLEYMSEILSLQSVLGTSDLTDLRSVFKSVLMKSANLEALANEEGLLQAQDIYYLYFDGIRRFPELKGLLEKQRTKYIENTIKVISRLKGQDLSEQDIRNLSIRFLVAVEGIALLQATADSFISEVEVEDILNSVLLDFK